MILTRTAAFHNLEMKRQCGFKISKFFHGEREQKIVEIRSNQSFNDRVHFQTQGCKFNDSYSENDSIVKLYPQGSRKRYNPYSKNDNSTYEGASDITENALTMGVFVYSKNDSSDFGIVSI